MPDLTFLSVRKKKIKNPTIWLEGNKIFIDLTHVSSYRQTSVTFPHTDERNHRTAKTRLFAFCLQPFPKFTLSFIWISQVSAQNLRYILSPKQRKDFFPNEEKDYSSKISTGNEFK